MAVNNDDVLAANENVNDNSSVSHQSLASSTTSVASSILEYRIENGRTYHKYKDGKYNLPNDGKEINRLDLQHNLFIRTFDDRLGTAPPNARDSNVRRVLDVGTGSGIWAIDFGDEHPDAEASRRLGHGTSVPPNVQFQVEDIEEDWHFSLPFDYIHSRMMTATSTQEVTSNSTTLMQSPSDDGTLTEECTLKKSFSLWSEAIAILGSPFEKFNRLEGVLAEVGFEDVRVERFKWPTNSWPKDPKFRELGIWNHENIAPHLEGMFMAGITRGLKWTEQEVHELAVKARKDFDDTSIHAYFQIWSIYGKKPVKA
ncbi:methyltransferase domain-containing protein [Colletotrichum abscissum]|uniref:Methyltransferase domain-containing protein n=1 Tax=Colletotrichum abscissum TaxID=1671311 RepID=A0A9Q0B038_9PEZI|nr:methyltransferase domain-containing protein [Colletotrichum abscissum]KAI3538870.1 methyltransferase domain-containing protein [Colletotrichum abscissum]KAK1516463.1 methyltransferase domain-containing protein [Colletotrichum abscissum]